MSKQQRLELAEKAFIAGAEAISDSITWDYAYSRWLDSLLKADLENECDLPSEGWECTRKSGHEGPCAAVQVESSSEAVVAANVFGGALEAIAHIFNLRCTAPEMVKKLEDVAKELSALRIWKDDAIIEFGKHERMFRELGEENRRLRLASSTPPHTPAASPPSDPPP